jgi:hypothetical protein
MQDFCVDGLAWVHHGEGATIDHAVCLMDRGAEHLGRDL